VKEDPTGCVFCKILAGELPASIVLENKRIAAFMDIRPVNTGHVLVIPRAHAPYLAHLDPDTGAHMFRTATQIAAAIRLSDLRCEGINLFLADGEAAMQEVFHVHLHVIPRFAGDGFGLKFPERYFEPTQRIALDDAARAIRQRLTGM
jgi:histidine triad (HIT) family protein